MEPIVWKDEYLVGNEIVDAEHREFCEIINSLILNRNAEVHSEFISEIFEKILKFASLHFQNEEQILQACNYPDLEEEKQEHDLFLETIDEMLMNVMQHDPTVPDRLLEFLLEQWKDHILVEHERFKDYL